MPYKDPAKNKEYAREWYKKHYQENIEVERERSRKYYQENKEAHKERSRKQRQEKPWIEMTIKAKKRKHLPFNITSEYIKSIWPKDNKCPALGIELKQGVKKVIDSSPTLDRIDNSKGYIKGNVQIVCNLANRIMTSATPEQVIQVGKHFKKVTKELGNEKQQS
jgi:hypothetical protein